MKVLARATRWLTATVAVAAVAASGAVMAIQPAAAQAAAPVMREVYVSMPGAAGPGPARYDRVHVLEVGAAAAHQVLILVPGEFGAAGSLAPLARELAARLPNTQVWAVDRREQDLADLSGFRRPPQKAAAYYLNGHYRSHTAQSSPYVARWGLSVELADLRKVVLAARDGGRRSVVLGGHSWGATTALAYAGWDFAGQPGYRGLSGLVLIDGGMHGAFAGEGDVYHVTPRQASAWLRRIRGGEVFDPTLTFGRPQTRPETFAILQQLAGVDATHAPGEPSAIAPLLPPQLRPRTAVTNLGLLRWLYVRHPLAPDLGINPAYTSIASAARDLAGPVPAAYEWYWPYRLTLDLEAADPFTETPTARELGLRLWHTTQINVPLYSFETGLTHGTVNQAARWVVAHSRIRTAVYAHDNAMAHLDPLLASPARNTMLKTLVPFLKSR
jgi:hypothetical protein